MNPTGVRTCFYNQEGLTARIPSMSYLKKGDRIRLVRKNRDEIIYATVYMDGHRVSDRYGTRTGNYYYGDPQKNYINIRFDHVAYGEGWKHPNDTIYERDHWEIYSTNQVALRIRDFIAGEQVDTRKAELNQKLADAERIIAEVRAELEELS